MPKTREFFLNSNIQLIVEFKKEFSASLNNEQTVL